MTQQEFFNRYNFDIRTDRLGGGGFGTVYKAYDSVLHREVALKVSEVKYGPNGKVFSLKDEFDAIKDLPPHPNIANYESLYSFDMPNGRFDYAVMQYYPGGNLSELLQKGLSYSQKEGLARQLLEGIAFLHQHKVVHRDLKPANILVEKRGIYYIPLITDFGLSKAAAVDDRSMFSNSFGGGTHRYSSPEQLQGKPLRLNTDLWSYGVVVYELFTGEPLFEAGSSAKDSAQADLEVYHKIIAGDVGGQLSKVPELWQRVLRRCLVVNPDQRVKEAGELLAMIGKTSTSRADYSKSNGIGDGTRLENQTLVENKRTVGKYGNDRAMVEKKMSDRGDSSKSDNLDSKAGKKRSFGEYRSIWKSVIVAVFAVSLAVLAIVAIFAHDLAFRISFITTSSIYSIIFFVALFHDNFVYDFSDHFFIRLLCLIVSYVIIVMSLMTGIDDYIANGTIKDLPWGIILVLFNVFIVFFSFRDWDWF